METVTLPSLGFCDGVRGITCMTHMMTSLVQLNRTVSGHITMMYVGTGRRSVPKVVDLGGN